MMENSGYKYIDDYLMGRLKNESLKEFEQNMQTDAAFAKEVAERKQMMDLLTKASDIEMKKEAQEVQAKFRAGGKTKPSIRRFIPWMTVAASLLFLVIAFWALQGGGTDQLFDDYYTAYDTGFGDRSENNAQEVKLAEASQYYQQEKYVEALAIFESVTDVKDGRIPLMTGISQLELGAYDKAILSFNKLIDEKDPAFQYHGRWYAAMTYLKSGNIEKCKLELQALVDAKDSNGVYKQDKAKILLKKL